MSIGNGLHAHRKKSVPKAVVHRRSKLVDSGYLGQTWGGGGNANYRTEKNKVKSLKYILNRKRNSHYDDYVDSI